MIVLRDINSAPKAGEIRMFHGASTARGERQRDDVVAGRPPKVLDHLAVAGTAEGEDLDHVQRIALHQNQSR